VVAEVPTSLVLVDRAGHGMPIPLSPPRPFVQPRFSPDGNRIAVATSGKSRDIWVLDIGRGGLIKLTSDGSNGSPVWTPDGERIIYRSGSRGPDNLFWRPSDGTGTPERISTSRNHQVPASCSPDGETLVLYDLQRESENPRSTRLETLSLRSGAQKPMPFIESGLWLSGADVSPDGQWIAYATNEAGREQTYVQAFGRPGQRQPVSGSRGGMAPVWRNDGKEIVFIVPPANDAPEGPIDVMAVPVTTTPVFVAGTPRKLFDVSYPSATLRVERHYDVAPDGQRFVFVAAADVRVAAITQVVFVQNWLEELKPKMRPTR
jgi:Tol biopolymer transport system component